MERKPDRRIKGTSSVRREHSTSREYNLNVAIDRRDLIGTPFEVIPKGNGQMWPVSFTARPMDNARGIIVTRYYPEEPVEAKVNFKSKEIQTLAIEDGWKVRIWVRSVIANFKKMPAELHTVIDVYGDELYIWHAPGLTTGNKHTDDIIHGRVPRKKKDVPGEARPR